MSWVGQLISDCQKEFADGPRIATLGTVNGDRPDARSIVVREIGDDGSMLFTSDSRSCKNSQLRKNPSANLVLWLPKLRRQYRVDGFVEILDAADPIRTHQWRESSDASRAMFFWPEPGAIVDPKIVSPLTVAADTRLPPTFEVLRLCPREVQVLDLAPKPHVRVRWVLIGNDWNSERINP